MRKLLFLLALCLPVAAAGQTVSFTGRASVGGDYKIVKGVHLGVEEELRMGDGFSSLGSVRTGVSLSYRPLTFLKVKAGYTLINPWKKSWSNFNAPRHRVYMDLAGRYPVGDFQFFLKERLQLTHRTGSYNVYETTPYALALKSSAGVKYKRFKRFEPSLSFEVRTALNDPWGTGVAAVDNHDNEYTAYTHTGYTHCYNNRYRTSLEADWVPAKHHVIAPYILADYCCDYEINTDSSGKVLKSKGYSNEWLFCVGLGYVYKF